MESRSHLMALLYFGSFLPPQTYAQQPLSNQSLINEATPSKSVYFDWINRNWYGSNQNKIEANLKYFKWLHDEYGMLLDVYLMDAGDIDQGPNCAAYIGLPAYGSLDTPWFKKRFPDGFGPIADLAKSFDCRLGVWLGPDGYGKTNDEAMKRKEMIVKFCKESNIALFKFDACCSDLSAENQKYFIETMHECRNYSPDLIILNHRITLNEEARKLTTTFLWEGKETYVDVNISNDQPAPHHRIANLSRGLPPGLNRLTEDHGVCFSSALDAWDEDLVLQAFNRNLILSPEIYGNPFLLNDEMSSRLARIFNIHRLYNDILVHGLSLPEDKYGKYAVSRGDSSTRLITLRNLTWQPLQVAVKLDASVGLQSSGLVEVIQYHPVEKFLGSYLPGSNVLVTVLPFRTSLIKISTVPNQEFIVKGSSYQVVKNIEGQPAVVNILGMAGDKIKFSLADLQQKYKKASLNGKDVSSILAGKKASVILPGKKQDLKYLKKLGGMLPADIPKDPEKYSESCIFAADNNALEVRELLKSQGTKIQQVKACREAFFNDTLFSGLGVWDRYAFDGDLTTSFKVRRSEYMGLKENRGSFRLDLGESKILDSLVFRGIPTDFKPGRIDISNDLSTWYPVEYQYSNNELAITLSSNKPLRYLRLLKSPVKVAEIEGYIKKTAVARDHWRASNLFGPPENKSAKLCWKYDGKLSGIGKDAKLSVTVPANCMEGTVFALLVADGNIIGANDRAPSFPYNNWEHYSVSDKNLTFYIPLDEKLEGKTVQVMLLSTDDNLKEIKPEVWQINPNLYQKAELILE